MNVAYVWMDSDNGTVSPVFMVSYDVEDPRFPDNILTEDMLNAIPAQAFHTLTVMLSGAWNVPHNIEQFLAAGERQQEMTNRLAHEFGFVHVFVIDVATKRVTKVKRD